MENNRIESILSIVQLFFLIKMAALFIGVALFVANIGMPAMLSFIFEDSAFYTLVPFFIPVIPLLMAILYGYVNWAYAKKSFTGIPIAIILLLINVFNFPIGTILSGLVLLIILFTASSHFNIKKSMMKTMPIRVIGTLVMVAGIVSVLWSIGIIDEFQQQFVIRSSGLSAGSLSVQDLEGLKEANGEIEIIVELSHPAGINALGQQNTFSIAVGALGGTVISKTTYVANTLLVSISKDKISDILANPNVRAVYENTFIPLTDYDVKVDDLTMLDNSYSIVNVEPLWLQGMTGKNVAVGIVDTGINHAMEWLQRDGSSVVIDGYELHGEYVHDHGTMCASVICSQNPTYKGIAPDCSLLNIEVFQYSGGELGADLNDILNGWDWLVDWSLEHTNYRVICSNSFGGPAYMSGADILRSAANNMVDKYNIPMIVAAGNEGPGPETISSPGDGKSVLSVGAIDDGKVIAYFSSRGPATDGNKKPDVVAPGVYIHLYGIDGSLETVSGTSFSTPTTAGVMACVVQENKQYKASQVINAFKSGVQDLGSPGYDYDYGYGLVDGEKTLNALKNQVPQGSYDLLFGVLPFIGFGLVISPELIKKRKGATA